MSTFLKHSFMVGGLILLLACTSKANTLLQEAENLLFNNRYHGAVRLFLQIVDRYPSSPQAEAALLLTGETFFLNLSEPERAIEYFAKLTSEFPEGEKAKIADEYIASIYENTLRDYDQAVIQYQRIIESGGLKQPDTYQFAIARCFYKKGDYKQAIIEYYALKERYPESELIADTDYQIGNCYFVMNDCEKANKWYSKVLKTYPETEWRYDILLSIGVCMEEKEDYGQALHIFRELMDSSPNKKLMQKKIDAVLERMKNKNR